MSQELLIAINAEDGFSGTFDSLNTNLVSSGARMGAVALSAGSLAISFESLQDTTKRVEDADLRLQNANINVTHAQNELNKAQATGDAAKIATAQDNLTKALDNQQVAANKDQIAHHELQLQQQQLALTVGALGLQMVSLASSESVVTAAQWLLNIAMDANPIGIIILAVGGLIALLGVITKGFSDWSGVINVVNSALQFLAGIAKDIYDALTGINNVSGTAGAGPHGAGGRFGTGPGSNIAASTKTVNVNFNNVSFQDQAQQGQVMNEIVRQVRR